MLAGERPAEVAADLVEAKDLSKNKGDVDSKISELNAEKKRRDKTSSPMSNDEYLQRHSALLAEKEKMAAYTAFRDDLSQILKR